MCGGEEGDASRCLGGGDGESGASDQRTLPEAPHGGDEEDAPERRARAHAIPRMPTRAEVESHQLLHWPFRNWCKECVRGRAISSPHPRSAAEKEERAIPMIAADYLITTRKEEDGIVVSKILVVADFASKAVLCFTVPVKGIEEQWIVTRVASWLGGLGYRRVAYRSDQEPAILKLMEAVKHHVACEMIPEDAPRGDSRANGFIETTIREVTGMIRTHKLAVETAAKVELVPTDSAMRWLVDHVGVILSRYKVGPDGETPYERLLKRGRTGPSVASASASSGRRWSGRRSAAKTG